MATFESKIGIGDQVIFTPMYRHGQERGIELSEGFGMVVAIRFSKAKVFYDIVDDYHGIVFDNVDSVKVKTATGGPRPE